MILVKVAINPLLFISYNRRTNKYTVKYNYRFNNKSVCCVFGEYENPIDALNVRDEFILYWFDEQVIYTEEMKITLDNALKSIFDSSKVNGLINVKDQGYFSIKNSSFIKKRTVGGKDACNVHISNKNYVLSYDDIDYINNGGGIIHSEKKGIYLSLDKETNRITSTTVKTDIDYRYSSAKKNRREKYYDVSIGVDGKKKHICMVHTREEYDEAMKDAYYLFKGELRKDDLRRQ